MGLFKKGAFRKLWAGAKDAVLKNRMLTEREKKFMAGFKTNLGPTLDDLEDLLVANKKTKKLDDTYQAAGRVITSYVQYLQKGKTEGDLNDDDADHLLEHLKILKSEMASAYNKVK